jgi:hypothetical protein
LTDGERTALAVREAEGKRLMYKEPNWRLLNYEEKSSSKTTEEGWSEARPETGDPQDRGELEGRD